MSNLVQKANVQTVVFKLKELSLKKEVIGQNHINSMVTPLKRYINVIKGGFPILNCYIVRPKLCKKRPILFQIS